MTSIVPKSYQLCSISQRYNSKAIHNTSLMLFFTSRVVLNISKIQFKSNSQPARSSEPISSGCAQYLKDTIQKQFTTNHRKYERQTPLCSISQRYNSKAIHNSPSAWAFTCFVVLNISKIQFKSNSQLCAEGELYSLGCAQYLKDTIQKQFTTYALMSTVYRCCAQYLKDTIQKQFTTSLPCMPQRHGCAQYLKDTIQKQFTTLVGIQTELEKLCSISQRYNSKAIHNDGYISGDPLSVVLNISKIQFKSNSQQNTFCINEQFSCAQYLKDTIQKQFTTSNLRQQ